MKLFVTTTLLMMNSLAFAKIDHPLILTIQEQLSKVSSIRADLKQVRRLSVFEGDLTANGQLLFKKPDQMRWQIDSPYQSALVYQAGQVAKFEKKNGKGWQRIEFAGADLMANIMQRIVKWQQGIFTDTDEFDLQVKNFKITLTPKSRRLAKGLTGIDLVVDQKTYFIKQVVIREPAGDHVEINFTNIIPNGAINSEVFNVK